MKRMLINATQEEELRMAMVDGQNLYDLNIELPASERTKANIYKGQITRLEPSLEAAFVNYGAERHGFLPMKEISSEYFITAAGSGKPNIKDVLREGQDIVVQVDKEERGNKGAALTTYVSLAGRFIVLKPNKDRSGGVSRRIVGEDRDLARKSLRDVEVPENMSVILRTAGIERNAAELTWDMENLLSVWEAIKKVIVERDSPFLLYRESNSVVRALRDYLTNEIGEILIDDEGTYKEAREFVEQVMPHNLRKLKHYADPVPLFTRYQIDSQIESAFAHAVNLPSGGSLVIDHTEALVSIDINSARATKGGDIEATALNTNLEAADEVARQLRLRDLGGLVVIDFIDMGPQKNQRDVENRLHEAVRQDRARVQLSKISRFGLLEMSRQRLRPSLGESSYLVCPRCSGIGNIRSVESLALAILRIIGEEARKERTAKVIAQLPIEVATYLLNEKREWVHSLESRHDTQVILVANPALETPHFQVRRVRDDQIDLPENAGNSFMLAESDDEPEITQTMQDKKPAELAAITTVVATTPAPPRQEPATSSGPGLLSRIAGFFAGSPEEEKPQQKRGRSESDSRRRGGQRNRSRSDSQRQGNKGQQRQNQQSAKKRGKKTGHKNTERKQPQNQGKQDTQRDENAPENKSDGQQTSKKRRSRGGRRRRRGQDATENIENQNTDTQQAEASTAPKETPNPQAEASTALKETPKADNVEKADSGEAANASDTDAKAKAETPKRKPRSRTPAAKSGQKADAPAADKSTATNKTADPKPAAAPKLTQVQTRKPAETKKTEDKPAADKPPVKVAENAAPKKVVSKQPTPARKKSPASSNHEDTQPELTTIKETAAPKVKKPVVTDAKETATPKAAPPPKPRPAAPKAVESGNDEQKPASKPTAIPDPKPVTPAKSAQDEIPAARLLPWDTDGASPGDKD